MSIRIKTSILLLTIFFTFCIATESKADNVSKNEAKVRAAYKKHPPKALLVEIFTYQRKLDYYRNTKNRKKMVQLSIDRDSIKAKMVADFNEHFKFCPVYFFYDSNAHLIQEGKFAGVLLDKDLNPVSNPPINNGDTSYLIAYYGTVLNDDAATTSFSDKNGDLQSSSDNGSLGKNRLVLMDHNFKQLPKFLKLHITGNPNWIARKSPELKYQSPTINIGYLPLAAVQSSIFKDFYDRD